MCGIEIESGLGFVTIAGCQLLCKLEYRVCVRQARVVHVESIIHIPYSTLIVGSGKAYT